MTLRRIALTLGRGSLLLAALSGCGDGSEAADPATTASPTSPAPTSPATLAADDGSGTGTTTDPPTTAPTTTVAPTVAPTTARPVTGWAIHDLVGGENNPSLMASYDAVSCGSELGPWDIVVSFDVPGNITNDVGFTVTLEPDRTGTVTGYEHSTWDGGLTVEGTSTGTATLVPDGVNHRLQFSYTETVVFSDGTNQTNEHDRDLAVIPATPEECP